MTTKRKVKVGDLVKVGIADAHGIESYAPIDKKNIAMLILRAQLNRQRHAVCYEAVVSPEGDKKIQSFLKKKDYIRALKTLKKVALEIKLGVTRMSNVQESWDMIPNPKLDPWR